MTACAPLPHAASARYSASWSKGHLSRPSAEGLELMGRTECNRVVNFQGQPRLVGQMVDVRITEAMSFSLRGEVLLQETAGAL